MSARPTLLVLVASTLSVVALTGMVHGGARSQMPETPVTTPSTIVRAPTDEEPAPASVPSTSVETTLPDEVETTVPGDVDEPVPGENDPAEDTAGPSVRIQPTVRSTEIAPASIVLALAVLAAVVLAWRIWAGQRRGRPVAEQPSVAGTAVAEPVDATTLAFLLELGEALVDAGDAVHNVAGALEAVARANGTEGLGAIVLPTALVISVPGAGTETTDVAIAGRSSLRLDQIESLMDIVDRAERGELTPSAGRRELRAIRSRPHRSSVAVQLAGSMVAAAGLALVLRGHATEVALAAALGLLVGMLNQVTGRAHFLYRPFWPLVASFGVATVTFATLRLTDVVAFPVLIAPLITFLPGALLTIAVLELATGQIISGSSRLASGGLQLVLLALGIVAGAQVVGVPASAVGGAPEGPIAVAGPWLGVAVFGIGIVWSQGLRSASIPAILAVLYVAYAGQVVGGVFVGAALSSFFGAVAMTPVAVLLARQGIGPPTLVTFLPGFWILVPGALGLEGVTRIIGESAFAATGALTTALTSMVGIALGVLLGLALATPDPQRPWTTGGRLHRALGRSG